RGFLSRSAPSDDGHRSLGRGRRAAFGLLDPRQPDAQHPHVDPSGRRDQAMAVGCLSSVVESLKLMAQRNRMIVEIAVITRIKPSKKRCGMRCMIHKPVNAPQMTGRTIVASNSSEAGVKR